jgi:hypothetical protein
MYALLAEGIKEALFAETTARVANQRPSLYCNMQFYLFLLRPSVSGTSMPNALILR